MPYDSSLDKNVFSKSWETDADRLNVSVYSYNEGPRKLQITRENKNAQGEFRYTKLGRMNKKEVTAIIPLIQESLGYLD